MNIGSINLGEKVIPNKSSNIAKDKQLDKPFDETYKKYTDDIKPEKDQVEGSKQAIHTIIKGKHDIESNSENELIDIKGLDGEDEELLQLICSTLQLSQEALEHVLETINLQPEDLLQSSNFSYFIEALLQETGQSILKLESSEIKKISELYEMMTKINGLESSIELEETQQLYDVTNNKVPEIDKKEIVDYSIQKMEPKSTNKEVLKEDNHLIKGLESNEETSLDQFKQEDKNSEKNSLFSMDRPPIITTQFTKLIPSTQGIEFREIKTHNNTIEYDIIRQIDFKSLGESKELTLQLSPKELGEMSIKIIQSQGILAAEIKVENEKVKEAVIQQLHQLEEQLQNQGIKIGDVQVDINQKSEYTYMEKQKQKSSKRIQEILSHHIEDIDEKDILINVTNSEVDYVV